MDSDRYVLAAREAFAPLGEGELALIDAAVRGHVAALGTGVWSFERSIDPRRTIRGSLLRWLLTDPAVVPALHPAGFGLRGARVKGPVDVSGVSVDVPVSLSQCALDGVFKLGEARFPSLVLDGSVCRRVIADRMHVAGSVSMRETVVIGRLTLVAADLEGDLVLDGATIRVGSGPALDLDAMSARRVFLRRGFHAAGEVRLVGADVHGDLDCSGGFFQGHDDTALRCEGARIDGRLMLCNGFRARGAVLVTSAKVNGLVNASRARFERARPSLDRSATALSLEGTEVRGGINLRGTLAIGEVDLRLARALDVSAPQLRVLAGDGSALALDGGTFGETVLVDAAISGDVSLIRTTLNGELNCEGAELRGGTRGSLVCQRATLGTVFLRPLEHPKKPFTARGTVDFTAAQINGDLDCSDANFGASLCLESARVAGTVACDGSTFDGVNGAGLDAPRAHIDGEIVWHPHGPVAHVDLTNAQTGTLNEHGVAWSRTRSVWLNGFTYGSISAPPAGQARGEWLRNWLELLRRADPPRDDRSARHSSHTVPQPYEQLAASLRSAGYEPEARRVSYERQEVRREGLKGGPRMANLILRVSIGHGFYPRRVLYCALGLLLVGSIVFLWARSVDALVPLTRTYPPALSWAPVYSLDTLLPIIDLGQEKRWRPAPDGRAGAVLTQTYLLLHILSGWLLATLGVAALGGLLRRER